MKKIALLFIFCALTVNAQKRKNGTIELTPKIGSSTSQLVGDYTTGLTSRSSVAFGVDVDLFFNNRWSLRSGLSADTMGARDLNGTQLNLNYLTIPINANWHFGSNRKWNLNFGVSPSILTSSDFSGTRAGSTNSDYRTFQMGLTYGIGYKIEISDDFSLLIDTQGFSGLTNIQSTGTTRRVNANSSINIGGVFHFN